LVEETTLHINPTFEDGKPDIEDMQSNNYSNESEQPPQDGGTIISDQEASELAATSNVEVI